MSGGSGVGYGARVGRVATRQGSGAPFYGSEFVVSAARAAAVDAVGRSSFSRQGSEAGIRPPMHGGSGAGAGAGVEGVASRQGCGCRWYGPSFEL